MFVAGNKPEDVHAATDGSSQGPRMADPSQPIPHVDIEEGALKDYVGQPPFTSDRIYDVTPVGVVMGLAWTAMGGNSLYIEAASVEEGDGKGGLRTTGRGDQLCFPGRVALSVCEETEAACVRSGLSRWVARHRWATCRSFRRACSPCSQC